MKKRSQMEIFGLAIIIVIITIAFFFYIGTRVKKPKSVSASYVNVEVAQRMVDALLDTKTDCRAKISEILRDCQSSNPDMCTAPGLSDSCEYAHATLQNALDNTLKKWNKQYRLTVTQSGSDLIPPIENGCDETMEMETPGIQPVPALPMISVKLEICKT